MFCRICDEKLYDYEEDVCTDCLRLFLDNKKDHLYSEVVTLKEIDGI